MNFLELPVHHTPFVKNIDGKVYVFCSAGMTEKRLDLWLISEDNPPKKIIDSALFGLITTCSPWVVERDGKFYLYATIATQFETVYQIAEFVAASIDGDYFISKVALIPGFPTYNSPCPVDNRMYFTGIREAGKLGSLFYLEDGKVTSVDLPSNPAFQHKSFMKPNIFPVANEELAMFILDIDTFNKYHTSVYHKKQEEPWKFVAEYTQKDSLQYKPFLYKGNLALVDKFSVNNTRLVFTPVKLSEVWDGFTDYPVEYSFPVMNWGV